MRRSDRNLWQSARDLGDLGECMALWLEGYVKTRPGYYGSTDLDSPELTTLCAGLCRAGFVTDNSQTGDMWDDRGTAMRAKMFVDGFANDDTLARLRAACEGTDLIVIAHRTPPRRWLPQRHNLRDCISVVSSGDGVSYLGIEGPIPRSYVSTIWGGIGRRAFRAVHDSWQVTIVDPEGGRNDLLLHTLTSRFLAGAR